MDQVDKFAETQVVFPDHAILQEQVLSVPREYHQVFVVVLPVFFCQVEHHQLFHSVLRFRPCFHSASIQVQIQRVVDSQHAPCTDLLLQKIGEELAVLDQV